MARLQTVGPAQEANLWFAARLAPAFTSLVLFVLFAHAGPTELAILAGASVLCYFEVVFALRRTTMDRHVNARFPAARRSAFDPPGQKPPELFGHIFRAAPYLRRAFPQRPFVGRSRNSQGLDAEADPICRSAFA